MKVPIRYIDERKLIEAALPEGYRISSEVGGDYFIHDSVGNYVGFVYVDGGQVAFSFWNTPEGDKFGKDVLTKFPGSR